MTPVITNKSVLAGLITNHVLNPGCAFFFLVMHHGLQDLSS